MGSGVNKTLHHSQDPDDSCQTIYGSEKRAGPESLVAIGEREFLAPNAAEGVSGSRYWSRGPFAPTDVVCGGRVKGCLLLFRKKLGRIYPSPKKPHQVCPISCSPRESLNSTFKFRSRAPGGYVECSLRIPIRIFSFLPAPSLGIRSGTCQNSRTLTGSNISATRPESRHLRLHVEAIEPVWYHSLVPTPDITEN